MQKKLNEGINNGKTKKEQTRASLEEIGDCEDFTRTPERDFFACGEGAQGKGGSSTVKSRVSDVKIN